MGDRKLELKFIDEDGKVYPLDEVTRVELAKGLEKMSKEIAKRLLLLKEQRLNLFYPFFPVSRETKPIYQQSHYFDCSCL
jgi:hypothetical protein